MRVKRVFKITNYARVCKNMFHATKKKNKNKAKINNKLHCSLIFNNM